MLLSTKYRLCLSITVCFLHRAHEMCAPHSAKNWLWLRDYYHCSMCALLLIFRWCLYQYQFAGKSRSNILCRSDMSLCRFWLWHAHATSHRPKSRKVAATIIWPLFSENYVIEHNYNHTEDSDDHHEGDHQFTIFHSRNYWSNQVCINRGTRGHTVAATSGGHTQPTKLISMRLLSTC